MNNTRFLYITDMLIPADKTPAIYIYIYIALSLLSHTVILFEKKIASHFIFL